MDAIIEFFELSLMSFKDYNLTISRILYAVLILIASVLIYKIAKRFLVRITTTNKISKIQSSSIQRFIRLVVIFATIVFVFKAMGLNTDKILGFDIIDTANLDLKISHLLILYLIFTGTKLFINVLEIIFTDRVKSKKIEHGKGQSLFQIIKYLIWVIAISLFLESLGFSVTFMIASMSALLVGLGLGIQHFFNDIVSGIIILFDGSIKIGDVVEIQGDMVGKIDEISLRTSKLISRDDVVVIVPNSMFTSDNVINWSHNSFKTRFNVQVGVAYGSDVELVKKILIEAATEQKKIDSTPAPFVLFKNFGDSSLDFEILFYTNESFRVELIKSDLRFTINRKFIENKIAIPFPQRDIHIIGKK